MYTVFPLKSARMLFAGFPRILESYENLQCHFPGPGKFGKGRFFKLVLEKFWICVWRILKHPKLDVA